MTEPRRGPYSTGWRRLLHPAVVLPVVAIVGVAVWWFAFRSHSTTATRGASAGVDQLVAVTFGPLDQTVTASGTIGAVSTDALSFAAPGVVTAVDVRAGDTVTTGQVLAKIDAPSLQAAVDTARATMLQAQNKLDADTAAAASDAQLAADQSQLSTATDAYDAAVTALAGNQLVANFDGVVTSVNIVVGQVLGSNGSGATTMTGSDTGSGASSANVGTGTASNAFTRQQQAAASATTTTGQINVQSTGVQKVDLQVASADIARVAIGQRATLAVTASAAATIGGRQQTTTTTAPTSVPATAATASGVVTSVGAIASTTTGLATFPVTVTFVADSAKFPIGATAVASIVTSSTGDVLSVPTAAVSVASDGSRTVLVSVDGTTTDTRTVVVTIGTTSGGRVEIRSGLAKGDSVVILAAPIATTATTVASRNGQRTTNGSGTRTGTGGSTNQRNGG